MVAAVREEERVNSERDGGSRDGVRSTRGANGSSEGEEGDERRLQGR